MYMHFQCHILRLKKIYGMYEGERPIRLWGNKRIKEPLQQQLQLVLTILIFFFTSFQVFPHEKSFKICQNFADLAPNSKKRSHMCAEKKPDF